MKRLTILRHAKASTGADDFNRPLSEKGHHQARRVAEELMRRGPAFDHVAASPAERVRQTLAGFAGLPEPRFDDALYMASAGALLRAIRAFPDAAGRALVVGHNPGLHELVLELAGPGALTGPIAARFPTATAATVTLPVSRWEQVEGGSGELVELILAEQL